MIIRLLTLVTATALAAAIPQVANAGTPGTTEHALAAMHDEAAAYADYQAWSLQADSVGNHNVAVLLSLVAGQERNEHFTELATITKIVGPSQRNLGTASHDESTEATETYPGFQARATSDGDTVTADLFGELAQDEASHKRAIDQALSSLCSHGPRPSDPVVDIVKILQQPAQTGGQTLTNVRTAMRGEAYASARYLAFSQRAYSEGQSWLGRFFAALADVELKEHYAALANRYGLVGSIGENLASAVAAENGAVATYAAISASASGAGDLVAASLFREIGSDELSHLAFFTSALSGI